MEQEDDEFFDQLQGCRKGKNAIKPETGFTGGVNGWFTSSGFVIKLKENVYRETPTEIIMDTFDIFTSSIRMIMFFQIITLFGMFCFYLLN